MSGKTEKDMDEEIEELEGLTDIEQADKLVGVFSSTCHEFDPINADNFSEYLHEHPNF